MKFATETDIEKLKGTATGQGTCADSSAMLFCMDKLIVCCKNAMKEQDDPTAHASIVATRLNRREIKDAKENCCIILSEKPCPMCVTGIFQAKIKNLYYMENNTVKYMDLNVGNINDWVESIPIKK